jgi:hypothetical protein
MGRRLAKYKASPAGHIASRPAQRAGSFPSDTAAGISRKGDKTIQGSILALMLSSETNKHHSSIVLLQTKQHSISREARLFVAKLIGNELN